MPLVLSAFSRGVTVIAVTASQPSSHVGFHNGITREYYSPILQSLPLPAVPRQNSGIASLIVLLANSSHECLATLHDRKLCSTKAIHYYSQLIVNGHYSQIVAGIHGSVINRIVQKTRIQVRLATTIRE